MLKNKNKLNYLSLSSTRFKLLLIKLIIIVLIILIYNLYNNNQIQNNLNFSLKDNEKKLENKDEIITNLNQIYNGIHDNDLRILSEDDDSNYPHDLLLTKPYNKSNNKFYLILHIIGIIYMFVGLGLVCDIYFVGALEVICESYKIQEDVAGATFMADGGSAPELFTSIMGVFIAKNDIGFGTIVGSAVFNVLFVIGLCAIFAKNVLVLTWWPLFRDCIYYIISLIILSSFVEDSKVEWWEALILFFLYLLYVYIMYKNQSLNEYFDRILPWGETYKRKRSLHVSRSVSPLSLRDLSRQSSKMSNNSEKSTSRPVSRSYHHNTSERGAMISVKRGLVHTISSGELGKEHMEKLERIATNKNIYDNTLYDHPEIKNALEDSMDANIRKNFNVNGLVLNPEITKGNDDIDDYKDDDIKNNQEDNDRNVNEENKQVKIIRLDSSTKNETNIQTHDDLIISDIDNDPDPIKSYNKMKKKEKKEQEQKIENENNIKMNETVESNISNNDIENGIINSKEYKNEKDNNDKKGNENNDNQDEDDEDDEDDRDENPIEWPANASKWVKLYYILTIPLVISLHFTLPNPNRKKWRKYFWVTFFLSLFWIAIFAYCMVWWTTILGDALGISPTIMGVTFLAAGTSVPDALSSVVVARNGFGDMAVSSSVGSNIFDILVGLPIPWLFKTAFISPGSTVTIYSDALLINVITLIFMVFIVVLAIIWTNWKLDYRLGKIMFVFYCLFVLEVLLLEIYY